MMQSNQPAFGSAILWGDGVVQGDSVDSSTGVLWNCNSAEGVLGATSGTWATAFMDPTSAAASDQSILTNGELGAPTGVKLATPASPYYPAIP